MPTNWKFLYSCPSKLLILIRGSNCIITQNKIWNLKITQYVPFSESSISGFHCTMYTYKVPSYAKSFDKVEADVNSSWMLIFWAHDIILYLVSGYKKW